MFKNEKEKEFGRIYMNFRFFETTELMAPEVIEKQLIQMDFFGQKAKEIILLNSEIIKHKLSHQHLFIRFFFNGI